MPNRRDFNDQDEWLTHVGLWFAGKAMMGLLAGGYQRLNKDFDKAIGDASFAIADSMMATLRRRKE